MAARVASLLADAPEEEGLVEALLPPEDELPHAARPRATTRVVAAIPDRFRALSFMLFLSPVRAVGGSGGDLFDARTVFPQGPVAHGRGPRSVKSRARMAAGHPPCAVAAAETPGAHVLVAQRIPPLMELTIVPAVSHDIDPAFPLHVGGKIEVRPTVRIRDAEGLALAYTPGVGRVSAAIAAHPELADEYTWRSNVVAVVTDGTAVLGLGDIGPSAALPVMEGKA